MEPWRGREGERVAQVGKDVAFLEAFLGEDLKAGLRDEGTSNAVRRSESTQPCSQWERKSNQLKTLRMQSRAQHSSAPWERQECRALAVT